MVGNVWVVFAAIVYVVYRGVRKEYHKMRADKYVRKQGFNESRQSYLHKLAYTDTKKFLHICGREKINLRYSREVDSAIRIVAEREGWKFCDYSSLCSDPEYKKAAGYNFHGWR